MYLTNRDKEILKFIEKYGSITINQCSKIFFTKNKEAYYQSRKRLKILSDNKYLQRYRQDMRSECVYYSEKKLSFHDLRVLDAYANLMSTGADIREFIREYIITCGSKEYRVDGLIECVYQGFFYPILIEIDYTHFTSTNKLLDIYNSNFFQNKYKDMDSDIFPNVLIARPIIPNIDTSLLPFNVLYTTLCIDNINKIFI